MPSRITSAAWSTDGTMLALGTINGLISIRNQQAEELQRIERRAPIWSLAFLPEVAGPKAPAPLTGNTGSQQNPAQEQSNLESLAVGCWDKTYSVYK